MTALPDSPDPARLVVRGPDCLPAVVPHLLGFHPDDSLVLLGLAPGSHAVRVTMRVDLPPEGEDATWVGIAEALGRAGATEALLVVYPPAGADPWRGDLPGPLPYRAIVDAAADLLVEAGVRAVEALCVVGDRMRSYWCRDESCCPAEGRLVRAEERLRVDAEFVALGSAPLASRRSLQDQLAARREDDPFVLQVGDLYCARRLLVPGYGVGDVDAFLLGLSILASGEDQPNLLATLVADASSLASWVRPRDLLMRALSVDADPSVLRAARTVLVEAVRCAPSSEVAPVASLLAVCAWLTGDGAAARVALDRAAAADPSYSLATLLSAALDGGLPPWAWSQMMADISVERLVQTGDGPPRARRPEDVLDELAPGLDDLDPGGDGPVLLDLDALGRLDPDDELELAGYDDGEWDEVCADPGCAACECARGTEGDGVEPDPDL